jgi:hypothetical protein
MRSRQKGITFIGWLILLVPVAIVGYAGIRLAPIYQINPAAIRTELTNHLYIDSVTYPAPEAFEVVRDGDKWLLGINYEDEVPLFLGISLVVKFDKRAPIG